MDPSTVAAVVGEVDVDDLELNDALDAFYEEMEREEEEFEVEGEMFISETDKHLERCIVGFVDPIGTLENPDSDVSL